MSPDYADREAIRTLTARYNLAADTGDLDGFADCFTEDGVFDIEGLVRVQGRAGLRGIIAGLGFPTHHMTTDAVIEVDGDYATQRCSFMLFGRRAIDTGMTLLTTSRYADRLVRTPAGWRFTERVSHTDNDLAQVLAGIHPPLVEALASLTG